MQNNLRITVEIKKEIDAANFIYYLISRKSILTTIHLV